MTAAIIFVAVVALGYMGIIVALYRNRARMNRELREIDEREWRASLMRRIEECESRVKVEEVDHGHR